MTLEIRNIDGLTCALAGDLFRALSEEAGTFHPHALDEAQAREIALHKGRDVYLVGIVDEPRSRAAVYGLLRGWNAGFEIPSLGVAVHPDFRGRGLGRLMVEMLHCVARLRGAKSVRLKVYPDNCRAVLLYESLGYVWKTERENGQLVGVLQLTRPRV